MSRLLTLAALLAVSLKAASAQPAQDPQLDPGTITVAGEGVVSAPPDRAIVRLGVTTAAPTPAEALRQHEGDVARVLARVRSFGIADREIEVAALRLSEDRQRDGPGGYQAVRVIAVTTDSLRAVPDLVASVVGGGANALYDVTYTLRDPSRYRDLALGAAVADARRRAELLARAAGVGLGQVVAIHEQDAGGVRIRGATGFAVPPPASVTIDPEPGAYSTGSSRVSASVVVRYSLETRQ